jgi:Tol biopolymer transport system component
MTSAPTAVGDLTGGGQVLGTVAYMSPEQVKGKSVDHRSDVFSFGCILYETATGARPFAADTAVDTMHNIVHQKPQPIDEINPEVPAELRRVIKRCMAKSPEQRLQSIKDLAIELREIVDEYDELSPSATSGTVASEAVVVAKRSPMLSAIIAAVVVLGVAGIAFGIWSMLGRDRTAAPENRPFQRVEMASLMSDPRVLGGTLSGDGRYLAYRKGPAGQWTLWVRQIATGSDVQILPPQTNAIRGVSFSPDGNYLYYLGRDPETPDYSALFEVASLGGTPRKRLFDVDTGLGFSPDGKRAAFIRGVPTEKKDLLMIVDLESGQERELAAVDEPNDLNFQKPAWSPDGSRIVCLVTKPGVDELVAFDANDGSRTTAADIGDFFVSSVAWQPDGSGLIATTPISTGGTRQVVRFPQPSGTPYPITNDLDNYNGVSISGDGRSIAAVRTSTEEGVWSIPAGVKGTARQLLPRSTQDNVGGLRPMPDGTIAFTGRKDRYRQLWTMAADGSGKKQITSGNGWSFNPHRLADGRGLVYTQWSDDDKKPHVWRVELDGGNQRKVTDGTGEFLIHVSPDGQTVLFRRDDHPGTVWRVGIGGGEPEQMFDDSGTAQFSPDGRFVLTRLWEEAGDRTRTRFRIHPAEGGDPVATFLPPGSAGGFEWTPDGSAIAYRVAEEGVENLWLQPSDGSAPRQLTRFDEGRLGDIDVSPDGAWIATDRSIDGVENVWTVPAGGGAPVMLSEFLTGVIFSMEWSRDSQGVIITQGEVRREVVLLTDAGE